MREGHFFKYLPCHHRQTDRQGRTLGKAKPTPLFGHGQNIPPTNLNLGFSSLDLTNVLARMGSSQTPATQPGDSS